MAKKKTAAGADGNNVLDEVVREEKLRTAKDLYDQQAAYRVYSTGSLMLDCAIGEKDPTKGNGGIPERFIVEIFGKNSCFKSAWTEQLMKSVLEDDPENIVMVVYAEEPDMGRLEGLGVDMERIIALGCYEDEEAKLRTAERMLQMVKKSLADERVKLVVIDSLKALCSVKQMYDKKGEMKELEDDAQIAIRAKLIGDFVLDFVQFNKKAILLMTNQMSEQIGMSFDTDQKNKIKTPGGRLKEYMAHLRIESQTKPIESEKEHPLTGKKITYGWEVWTRIIKNKFSNSTSGRTSMSEFYFKPAGFRKEEEVFKCAEYLEIIEKTSASMYKVQGEAIRGRQGVMTYLKENPTILQNIEKQVLLRSEELFNFRKEAESAESLLT